MIRTQVMAVLSDPDSVDSDWAQEADRLETLIHRAQQGEALPTGLLVAVLADLEEMLEDEPEAALALMQAVVTLTINAGPDWRELRRHVLGQQATLQADLGRDAAALHTHRAIIAEFASDPEAETCVRVVESQFAVAEALTGKKIQAAIDLYDVIIARHGNSDHAPLRDLVVRAKMMRALRLPGGGAGQIADIEAFLVQFCGNRSAGIVAVVADCFLALADLVAAHSGPAAGQAVRNRMLAWAADPDLHVQNEPISTILLDKFTSAADQGDWVSAREAAQAILDRGATACTPVYHLLDQVFIRDQAAIVAGGQGDALALLLDLAPGRRDPDDFPIGQVLAFRQAYLLRDAGQIHAALAKFEEAIRLGAADDHDRAHSLRAALHLEAGALCDQLQDRRAELAHYDAVLAAWRDEDNPEITDLRLIALLSKRTLLFGQEDYAGAEAAGQRLIENIAGARNAERRLQIAEVQGHRIALAQYAGDMAQVHSLRLDLLEAFGRDHDGKILALIIPEALLAMRTAMTKAERHVVTHICWALWDLVDHVEDHALLVQICRAALECGLYLESLDAFEDASEQFHGVCRGFQACGAHHPDYQAMLDLAAIHLEQCRTAHLGRLGQDTKPRRLRRLTQSLRGLFGR